MIISDIEALPNLMRDPNKDILGSKSDSELIALKRESALSILENDLKIILDITDAGIFSLYLTKYEIYLKSVLSYLQLREFYFQNLDAGDTLTMFRYDTYALNYNEAKTRFKTFNINDTPYMNASSQTYNLFR